MEYAHTNSRNDDAPAVELKGSELHALTRILSKAIIRANAPSKEALEREDLAARAEQHYAFRRKRERLTEAAFGAGIFADPAWDMLLDLYARTSRGTPVGVTSLCIAAAAPPTTALRYVAELEKRGIIHKVGHPTDKRSFHVRLTEEGLEVMDRICAQLPELQASSRLPVAFRPFS